MKTTKQTIAASTHFAYWREMYHPVTNGVHVCGVSYERYQSGEFCTVANFPHSDPRRFFEALRDEYATTPEEGDVVVDLVIDGDTCEDFWARRQSVELMQRAALAELPDQ